MPSTVELALKSAADLDVALNLLEAHGALALEWEETSQRVFGRFSEPPEHRLWRTLSGAFTVRGLGFENLKVREAESLDWESVWRPFPKPFEIGGVWIVPEECERKPVHEPAVVLEQGGAFGSGLHPTTALCLEALTERPPTASLLDFGCGTGILALVALELGTGRAIAVDNDPMAVAVTLRNAQRNHLVARIEVGERWNGQAHRVIANVLATPLIDVAPDLTQRLLPGGELWLSGIQEDQIDAVSRAYRRCGLHAVGVAENQGWYRLDFRTSW